MPLAVQLRLQPSHLAFQREVATARVLVLASVGEALRPTSDALEETSLPGANYMEHHRGIVCHSTRNYWYEVGTKSEDRGTNFDELGTEYNPEVIKYRPI